MRLNFFWGLVILVIGLLLLAENLGWVSDIMWDRLWELWPLLAIAIGTRMIVRTDGLFALAILALFAVGGLLLVNDTMTVQTHHTSFSKQFKISGEKSTFNDSMSSTGERFALDLGGHYNITVNGDPTATTFSAALSGPKEIIDQLEFEKDGDVVLLRETGPGFNFLNFNNYDDVTGTITVPATAIDLDLSGLTTVTLTGTLDKLTVDGSGAVTVISTGTTVTDPDIDLSGAGTAKLGTCTGTASFKLSGAGEIHAQNCTLDKLTADMSGAGEIEIENGTIKDADLKTSGAASIKIPKPTGSVKQDNSGASNIELKTTGV